MQIDIKVSAIKDLKNIDNTEAKRILGAIENLGNYPDVPNIKKLVT